MRWLGGKALPRNILIILTAIVVMVSFPLAAAESLWAVDFAADWRGGLAGGAYYHSPEQAGDPALFTESDDTRFSLLRMESQRFFTPWGVSGPGYTFYLSQFKTSSKCGFVSIKDTIFLKLRI